VLQSFQSASTSFVVHRAYYQMSRLLALVYVFGGLPRPIPRTASRSHVVRCSRVLLVAGTPWEIWIARMASALVGLVTYLGERDFRIAE
jgi:hypothetical protein